MEIVINASPLIFLAKIGMLDLLKSHKLIIPSQVYDEIFKGGNIDIEDVFTIRSLVSQKRIMVEESEIIKDLEKQNLGLGEKAAISLAVKKKINLILIDERKARKIAKFYRLKTRGTIGVLIEALHNKKISKREFVDSIQKLIKEGYRIKEELLIELLNMAE